MPETFEKDLICPNVDDKLNKLSLNFPEEKKINLEPEKSDLEFLGLSIKDGTQSDISGEKNKDSKEKLLPKDVLKYLDNNYKRIIPSSGGVEPIDVIKNLSQQEKDIYNDYLYDYRYLRQYILNPEFKNKVQRASGLTDNYIDNIMNQIYDFFKYDTPQNELIINHNQNSKVNGRTISFLGKQAKDNVIILYKEGREKHYGVHEISHLIVDEINKVFNIQPEFSLFDNNSFVPDNIKNYVRMKEEHYPHLFQLRAKYNMIPGQKINIAQAKRLIAENRDNIMISMMSPIELKKIMNNW